MKDLKTLLSQTTFSKEDLARLVSLSDPAEREALYKAAYAVKAAHVGRVAYYRGLVEFSNICVKDCLYCGIRKSNHAVARFESSMDEILEQAKWIYENHYGSIVLQSGERTDPKFIDFVDEAVRGIKALSSGRLGITLCVGEQSKETYARWFESGAHRYLLRIEESNPAFYATMHPADGHHLWQVRNNCLLALREVGYQVGTGVMIGLPGQTAEHLADDLLYFRDMQIDMIGMGPYIVAAETPMGRAVLAAGADTDADRSRRFELGLNMIAAARLLMPDVNIAATTALQGLHKHGRELGLRAGANVLMPMATLPKYRKGYQLYDGKPCVEDTTEQCLNCLTGRVRWAGDTVGYDAWGDSKHYFERRGVAPRPGQEAGEGRRARRTIPICEEKPAGACDHFQAEAE